MSRKSVDTVKPAWYIVSGAFCSGVFVRLPLGRANERKTVEDIRELSILYDFYGALLPEKMQEIFRMYHEENLSLAEISNQIGGSRQGIHETVKRAEEKLREYEAKLGLAEKYAKQEKALERLERSVSSLQTLSGTRSADSDAFAGKQGMLQSIASQMATDLAVLEL